MRILFEEHKYPYRLVKDDVWEGVSPDPDDTVTFKFVGYFYNAERRDCVLLLPRVLLEDGEGGERVFVEHGDPADRSRVTFSGYTPEQIIDPEAKTSSGGYVMLPVHRKFLREFAVWIYRAITLYWRSICDDASLDGRRKREGIHRRVVPLMGCGRLRDCHTLLDVILALRRFHRDHMDFVFAVFRDRHRGMNKINWPKTVVKSSAVWSGGNPVYPVLVNRRKEADYDDELFRIFYSILEHVNHEFGFPAVENPGFETLSRSQFDHCMHGFGKIRLKQIKGKYFSDIALQLWELCYAYFEYEHEIRIQPDRQEYLLAKSFQVVFEAMVDDLVGDKDIPRGLKEQDDGKRVDHMYRYPGLTVVNGEESCDREVYYIGDSKYYKRRTKLGKEAVYKQFTYARNVIQWNLNLFLDGKNVDGKDLSDADLERAQSAGCISGVMKMRDDATEGYAITPNFFISARLDDDLDYNHDEITQNDKSEDGFLSRQFENRLFDRDTLLIAHYDVNFLFVLSRYARNNAAQKDEWRVKVRKVFKDRVRKLLQKHYTFYAMTPKGHVDAEAFFRENFKDIIGRVYDPYGKRNGFEYYSLALRNNEDGKDFTDENEAVLGLMRKGFVVERCDLGVRPEDIVTGMPRSRSVIVPADKLTFHWLENYKDADVIVGLCKSDAHLQWMMSRSTYKASDMYNVRADRDRNGCVNTRDPRVANVRFLVLYFDDTESDNKYRVYRIRNGQVKSREWLEKTGYPFDANSRTSERRYYCYYLEEEVSLGSLNIGAFLARDRISKEARNAYVKGCPIFLKGADLLEFRTFGDGPS